MRRIASQSLDFCRAAHRRWVSSKERWWYISGGLLLSVIFTGPSAFMQDRIDNMTALLNVPDQLWGKWLVIALGFGLICVGIWRSEVRLSKLQEASADDQIAARAHELEVLAAKKEAMRLPILMAKAALFERELLVFADVVERVAGMFAHFKIEAARWFGDDEFPLLSMSERPPDPEFLFHTHYFVRFHSFEPPTIPIQWEPVLMDTPHDGKPGHYRVFKPLTPLSLVGKAALQRNVNAAEAKVVEMRQFLDRQKEALVVLHRKLDIELGLYAD